MKNSIFQVQDMIMWGERRIGYIDYAGTAVINYCGYIRPSAIEELCKKYKGQINYSQLGDAEKAIFDELLKEKDSNDDELHQHRHTKRRR